MKANQSGHRWFANWQGQLCNQALAIGGVQRKRVTVNWQLGPGADFDVGHLLAQITVVHFPATGVKVASSFNREVGWPGHQVAGAPLDYHGAIWAYPALSTVLGLAVRGLHKTWHTIFHLGALHAHSNQVEVQFFRLLLAALTAAWPIAAAHR